MSGSGQPSRGFYVDWILFQFGLPIYVYYFEPEGPNWLDYQDDDGIELQSDAEALIYAYQMIRELKADYQVSDPLHLLVKNWVRKTIFCIAFE
jgi:hypothetical protein